MKYEIVAAVLVIGLLFLLLLAKGPKFRTKTEEQLRVLKAENTNLKAENKQLRERLFGDNMSGSESVFVGHGSGSRELHPRRCPNFKSGWALLAIFPVLGFIGFQCLVSWCWWQIRHGTNYVRKRHNLVCFAFLIGLIGAIACVFISLRLLTGI